MAGKPIVPVLTARLSEANPWNVTGLVSVIPAYQMNSILADLIFVKKYSAIAVFEAKNYA